MNKYCKKMHLLKEDQNVHLRIFSQVIVLHIWDIVPSRTQNAEEATVGISLIEKGLSGSR